MGKLLKLLPAIVLPFLSAVTASAGPHASSNEKFFQFGLFPPVSSNGASSGRTVNSVSVNLIGGYSAGTGIFELGGVWNASREYTKGLQVAGLLNYSGHSCNSVQISGFGNISASGDSPLQIAGLLNVGKNVNGLQLSAFLNVAETVSGVQIGLVNYMKDGERGVSIGLVNIAKHGGKYEFEVAFSEAINTLLSFRLGTDRFYTIFSGGINWFSGPVEYAVGIGFGTDIKWRKRWSNQIEVQAFGLSRDRKLTGDAVNSIIQLRLPFCKEFARHFKVFAGPTVNLHLQSPDASGNTGPAPVPWSMWSARLNDLHASGWIGLSAGLRF